MWQFVDPGVVAVPVTGVTVSPTSANMSAGSTRQLTATVAPSSATNQNVAWTSSDTSAATVNGAGLVTAVAAGAATITVTTEDGNKTATCAITVTPATVTYYNIVNRWRPEYYLYDGGDGQVKYGTNPGSNTLYQWARIDAGGGYVRLKNRSTGNYMHVENQNGSVQCGAAGGDWYSAQWTIANATDGWNYIQNRWQTGEWIHIENLLGYAQYANPQSVWYSAMWQFVNPVVCHLGRWSYRQQQSFDSPNMVGQAGGRRSDRGWQRRCFSPTLRRKEFTGRVKL
jgi:Bacterial Ig-like domain (group 2)